MKNKWLNITDRHGNILRIRKDKIVAISLLDKEREDDCKLIKIYIETHITQDAFRIGMYCGGQYGLDYYLDKKTFYELRAYLDEVTQMKGELNLNSE